MNINRLIISGVTTGLLFFSVACSSSKSEKKEPVTQVAEVEAKIDIEGAKKSFEEGNAYLDQRQFEPAITAYKESISKNPEVWETYMNAAIATIMTANTVDALDLIQKAYENGGDKEQVLFFNLGNIYQERGLYHSAADAYRMGFSVGDPNDIDSLINLAACYALTYDLKSAEETYDRILEIDPNRLEALHGKAYLVNLEGDAAKVLEMYNNILVRKPDYAPVLYAKADLLHQIGRLAEARTTYQDYKRLNPEGPYMSSVDAALRSIESELSRKGIRR